MVALGHDAMNLASHGWQLHQNPIGHNQGEAYDHQGRADSGGDVDRALRAVLNSGVRESADGGKSLVDPFVDGVVLKKVGILRVEIVERFLGKGDVAGNLRYQIVDLIAEAENGREKRPYEDGDDDEHDDESHEGAHRARNAMTFKVVDDPLQAKHDDSGPEHDSHGDAQDVKQLGPRSDKETEHDDEAGKEKPPGAFERSQGV